MVEYISRIALARRRHGDSGNLFINKGITAKLFLVSL